MKWRPIGEATRGNADTLLWVNGYACVGHRSFKEDGLWYCELQNMGEYVEPTHWMPLPEPPEVGDGS